MTNCFAHSAETHPEYLSRIAALEAEKKQRVETLGLYARLQLESLETSVHWETLLADRMLEAQRKDLGVKLMDALVERKRKLERLHRQSEEVEAELHERRQQRALAAAKPVKRGAAQALGPYMSGHGPPEVAKSERKKFKAMLVEWPFIIYQLRDTEIQEDLAAIKRAVKSSRRPQPSMCTAREGYHGADLTRGFPCCTESSERDIDVHFEDGKLFYDKRWYERGQSIYVENRDQVHYSGSITAINTGEVCHASCHNSCYAIGLTFHHAPWTHCRCGCRNRTAPRSSCTFPSCG